MKVGIRQQDDVRFYYPDVQVTCVEETETYYNTAPCLVIEVLSESTARKDRTEKLIGYQLLNSLQEYLICSQDTPIVELYRRRTHWQRERFTDNQSFILESVDLELVVNDLYDFLLKD
jgi:Uma2 family endonuclease